MVLGGPGYSIFPHAVLAYIEAESGIQGEGKVAMPLLLDRIKSKAAVTDIPGLILPKGRSGPPPERVRSLDDSPLPQPGLHLVVPGDVDADQLGVPFRLASDAP